MVLLSNGLRNVPTTELVGEVAGPQAGPEVRDVPEDLRRARTRRRRRSTAAGSANQEAFNSFTNKWQAGRVSDLEAGLQGRRQAIDAQLANAEGKQVP